MARSTLSYQKWPLIVTVVGLGLSGWLGWRPRGHTGACSASSSWAHLGVLKIALSFDNAIVNANKLEEMTPFGSVVLTWGILIAVSACALYSPWRLLHFRVDQSLCCDALGAI